MKRFGLKKGGQNEKDENCVTDMTKTASLTKKLSFYTAFKPALFKVKGPVVDKKKRTITRRAKVALKKTIELGSVVILLNGRFKGKRVVVLKQLDSGLLLVSGPFKVNGVPLRRVNQRSVISTSTKVNVAGVDVSNINDEFFSRKSEKKISSKDLKFFTEESLKKKTPAAARVEAQKKVDAALEAVISKDALLQKYLGARFSLRNGMYPHALKF